MNSSGPVSRLEVTGDGAGLVSQAGGLLLVETARVTGLAAGLSAVLRPWRRPRTIHDPGKIAFDLGVSLALAGTVWPTLQRCATSRGCSGRCRRIRGVPLVDMLAGDVRPALEALRAARAAGRARVWSLSGPVGAGPMIVDLDATISVAHSEKELAAPTFKRTFASIRCLRSSTTVRAAPAAEGSR